MSRFSFSKMYRSLSNTEKQNFSKTIKELIDAVKQDNVSFEDPLMNYELIRYCAPDELLVITDFSIEDFYESIVINFEEGKSLFAKQVWYLRKFPVEKIKLYDLKNDNLEITDKTEKEKKLNMSGWYETHAKEVTDFLSPPLEFLKNSMGAYDRIELNPPVTGGYALIELRCWKRRQGFNFEEVNTFIKSFLER